MYIFIYIYAYWNIYIYIFVLYLRMIDLLNHLSYSYRHKDPTKSSSRATRFSTRGAWPSDPHG